VWTKIIIIKKNTGAFNCYDRKFSVFEGAPQRRAEVGDNTKFANSLHVFWSRIHHNTHLASDTYSRQHYRNKTISL